MFSIVCLSCFVCSLEQQYRIILSLVAQVNVLPTEGRVPYAVRLFTGVPQCINRLLISLIDIPTLLCIMFKLQRPPTCPVVNVSRGGQGVSRKKFLQSGNFLSGNTLLLLKVALCCTLIIFKSVKLQFLSLLPIRI